MSSESHIPDSWQAAIDLDEIVRQTFAQIRHQEGYSRSPAQLPDETIAAESYCMDTTPIVTDVIQRRLALLGGLGLRAFNEIHTIDDPHYKRHDYTFVGPDTETVTWAGTVIDMTHRQFLSSEGKSNSPLVYVGTRDGIINTMKQYASSRLSHLFYAPDTVVGRISPGYRLASRA